MMFWGASSLSGDGEIMQITENMKSDDYINVIDEILKAKVRRLDQDRRFLFR